MRRFTLARGLAAALILAPGLAAAQDPMMAANQMIMSFQPACQMGDPNACGAIEYVMGLAQTIGMAGPACQAGNPDACAAYQQAYGQLGSDYSQWAQVNMGGGMAPTAAPIDPNYDPNNVLGATHADRMAAIAQFGADSTRSYNDRMTQMDQQQSQFLGTLGQ